MGQHSLFTGPIPTQPSLPYAPKYSLVLYLCPTPHLVLQLLHKGGGTTGGARRGGREQDKEVGAAPWGGCGPFPPREQQKVLRMHGVLRDAWGHMVL